mmetsp:Transcript_120676/g.240297  ORF Transcript_120676/g.240297 Transcript_120676/m.240297 type:complete len:189 (-) Transcript_120676:167-733(-)|eukprot:CAMPEP_0172893636 /NCGR_PEP_ID=MMETSP1075-20121228/148991_1 /TAXON_ID=2916 /ORGANISM="Ceratium fusus, Strain PA161109" /LENGTH=188 /DNA_ID=CAMNT_0013748529 /DNA_START=1 /DNA_END=567 /DNA_ORIENTATION=+
MQRKPSLVVAGRGNERTDGLRDASRSPSHEGRKAMTQIRDTSRSRSPRRRAVAVSVKAAVLRQDGYVNLETWLADKSSNLYVGRRGRIFIKDEGAEKSRIFHYPASKWQNPFAVGKDGTREEVCSRYRNALLSGTLVDPASKTPLREMLSELQGLRLGCWCRPEMCHADVLAELANGNASGNNDLAKA